MDAFDRLREVIDNIQVGKSFSKTAQDLPNLAQSSMDYEQSHERLPKKGRSINQKQLDEFFEQYECEQKKNIERMLSMETHLEYLTSSLKSALENNEILIAQITALKNENQKIGKILQVYWAQNQNIADKQRKYKEEIARVNVTVDQLAKELNIQRAAKKQLVKEVEEWKSKCNALQGESLKGNSKFKQQYDRLLMELQQTKEMYELSLKKNSNERFENRNAQVKLQADYEASKQQYQKEIQYLKAKLFDLTKLYDVTLVRKEGLENNAKESTKANQNISTQLKRLRNNNEDIINQLNKAQNQIIQLTRKNEELETKSRTLANDLVAQRKIVKVKVVEIEDETTKIELQMYKKQCKQLMQDRALMNRLNRKELLSVLSDDIPTSTELH